jgi:protein kinase A
MVAPIGAGCFGAVHLAKNHMNKPVAIKVVSKDFAIKMNQQTHLLSEKKLMMNLNSTYTLKWYIFDISYETFQDADNIYFVNEYVPGGTVGNAIKRLKYSIEAITFYTAEIIIALGFLHNKKIIYRDLKSDNILIDSTGHVKLIDFGLGKEMDSLYTTTICGTPAYISPEQLEGKSTNFN